MSGFRLTGTSGQSTSKACCEGRTYKSACQPSACCVTSHNHLSSFQPQQWIYSVSSVQLEQRPQKGAWPASSRDRVRPSRSTDASTVAIVASLCERTTVASLSTTVFNRQQVGDAQTSGNAWVSVRNDHSNEHRILTCIGNRHVSDET